MKRSVSVDYAVVISLSMHFFPLFRAVRIAELTVQSSSGQRSQTEKRSKGGDNEGRLNTLSEMSKREAKKSVCQSILDYTEVEFLLMYPLKQAPQ